MDLSILFIPFQKAVFLCEGRALEVAKAVLPSHSPSWLRRRLFRWRKKRVAIAEDNVKSRSVPLARRLGLIV